MEYKEYDTNSIAQAANGTNIITACVFFVAITIGCNYPCFGVSVPYHTFQQRKLLNFFLCVLIFVQLQQAKEDTFDID